jgi:hypothetical protein
MSTPKKAAPKPAPYKPAAPKTAKLAIPTNQAAPAKLVNDGGKPANGRHVPSSIPGGGASDYSNAVGSNVTPAKGVKASASPEVMDAPPQLPPYVGGSMNGSPIC